MVESTLRDAIGHLAATFWANKRLGPTHHEGEGTASGSLCQSIQDLLRAFGNRDPPNKKQKAAEAVLGRTMTIVQVDSCKGLGVIKGVPRRASALFLAFGRHDFGVVTGVPRRAVVTTCFGGREHVIVAGVLQ